MKRTAVINVVGLSPALLEWAPRLKKFAADAHKTNLSPSFPSVTCTVQSSFLTGETPSVHGVVANGWYYRDLSEIWFWRQSGALVGGETIWEAAKKRTPDFTCAKIFWWFNMYSGVDYSITPRPLYPADGRKIPDIHTRPASFREELNSRIGEFPLFHFWGPMADIKSSEWIAESAKITEEKWKPTLSLVYLPHLDYNLQRLGPRDPLIKKDVEQVDRLAGGLLDYYHQRQIRVIVLSEYGIQPVTGAIAINRILRKAGFLSVRNELGRELLDAGASEAFAVADHQVAHVYVKNTGKIPEIKRSLADHPGIEKILDAETKKDFHLDHPRSGDLVLLAKSDKWFSYYYWMDDKLAPDFARTVDIHRKPGYDPVELFVDPAIRFPRLKAAGILLKKKLGFRYLMDLIPLDSNLVKGSHGVPTNDPDDGPLIMAENNLPDPCRAGDIKKFILDTIFE